MNGYKVFLLCLLLLLWSTVAYTKILFGSERDGEVGKPSGGVPGIYVMDDDGSNLTLLIESKEWKPGSARWSPDGKQIVFEYGVDVYLMNPDGTSVRRLINREIDTFLMGFSFSPDSKSIVFSRDFDRRNTITVMDIATREMKVIADVDAVNCEVSPDGKQIVFDKPSAVGGGGNTIWIMDADGHKRHPRIRPLIPPPPQQQFFTHRLKPRWSPDGQKILFMQREYIYKQWPGLGNALIYLAHRYMICDRNGENIKQLGIPIDYDGVSAAWADDGASVVFTARKDMPLNEPIPRDFVWPPSYVYKYHIRTDKITQLTDDPGWDQIIDWISDDVLPVSPAGKKKVTWGTLKQ